MLIHKSKHKGLFTVFQYGREAPGESRVSGFEFRRALYEKLKNFAVFKYNIFYM